MSVVDLPKEILMCIFHFLKNNMVFFPLTRRLIVLNLKLRNEYIGYYGIWLKIAIHRTNKEYSFIYTPNCGYFYVLLCTNPRGRGRVINKLYGSETLEQWRLELDEETNE